MAARISLSQRIVHRLPKAIYCDPERILLNFAVALIGLSAFLFPLNPSSLMSHWWHSIAYGWALAMAWGGISLLFGIFAQKRIFERMGLLLVGIATAFWGFSAIWVFGWRGVPTGLIFLGLASAKWIRYVATTAERDDVIQFGMALEELDHEDEDGE